jgi:uncharacterized protein YfbU (UPF0304 family)
VAVLNVRVDDETRDSLEALARGQNRTVSELLRSLIDDALGRTGDTWLADTTPAGLSAVERQNLALLHEILRHVTPDDEERYDAEWHSKRIDVLQRGYVSEYHDEFAGIEPELSKQHTVTVNDILDMFHNIETSVAKLPAEDRDSLGERAENALRFAGFDENDRLESRMLTYARHLINSGRWESMKAHFAPGLETDRGNSHAPLLSAYLRMLRAWKPMRAAKLASHDWDFDLNRDELAALIAARRHPDAR